MKLEYDLIKRLIVLEQRGLDMARAGEVFEDLHLTCEDDRMDYGETRFISVGYIDQRMVVIVWTHRNGARRIISMRKANEREQNYYGARMAGS
jgi:uncharacterized protein